MRILIYHPVKLPVSHYGGSERVLMWLAQTLMKMGHEVSVFAAPGSHMPNGIHCITDFTKLESQAKEFDILHGFSRMPSEFEASYPHQILYTVQGNGRVGETFYQNTVFVSDDHAKRHGAQAFVYNGLDPDELKFAEGARPNRFLFLSKTSWKVKNANGAARLASKYHQNLWLAGGDRPYGLKCKVGLNRLLGRDWKWVGSVDQKQKAEFLTSGKAMLFPLLWNEPFGLVMTESLVSGTPFYAHPYGSVSEILEFAPECVMRTEADWKNALTGQIPLPSAKRCREWVLEKFDQVTMAKAYVKLYEKVARGERLNASIPKTLVGAEDVG